MTIEYQKALDALAVAREARSRAMEILRCKDGEIEKTIAAVAIAEGIETVSGRTRTNAIHSWIVVKGSAPGTTFDVDKAKELLTANGIPIPMKAKKGSAATLRRA